MKTKTKLTVAILSAISLVGLAGTGYAGWVIAQNASGSKDGNIDIYEVTDNGVAFSDVKLVSDKDSIIFGKPSKEDKFTQTWFNRVGDREVEYFTPAISFTVKNNTANDEAEPVITAQITVKDTNDNAYASCLSENYIKGPEAGVATSITIPTNDFLTQDTTNKNTFTGELSVQSGLFGWGSHFNDNPYNFYNAHTAEEKVDSKEVTYSDDAKAAMGAIAKLKDVMFTINITASHA